MTFRNFISLIIFLIIFYKGASSQELSNNDTIQKKGPWLYVNQPISLIYKFNPQLGYRFSNRHAIVVGLTAYYIKRKGETLFNREYSLNINGSRYHAEYRYHFTPQSRFETYAYGNLNGGSIDYKDTREGLLFGFSSTDEFKGRFLGGGLGVGHQLFFRKEKNVILQFNYGFSYFHLYQVNGNLVTKEEATKMLISTYSFFPLELSIRLGFRL